MLKQLAGLAASQSWIRDSGPVRRIWLRFVAGEQPVDAICAARRLRDVGLLVSVNHVGRLTAAGQAPDAESQEYEALIDLIASADLADVSEVSVKLSALGLNEDHADARPRTRERLLALCRSAADRGVLVTLDAERHEDLPFLVATALDVRETYPWLGVAIPANHPEAESLCARLATQGSRVRLVKGDFGERARTRASRHNVDRSYVRCLSILMRGPGHPMVATHDPRIIRIALDLVGRQNRTPGSYEFQMLHGLRRPEQQRLVRDGHHVRVYVPYGDGTFEWMTYLLADKPSSPALLARALLHDS